MMRWQNEQRSRRSDWRGTFLALSLCASACGPSVGLRVEQKSIQDLPLESRLDLLDAENDLFSAVDRRDEAEQVIEDARVAERRARERVGDEEHSLDRARDTKDQAGTEVGKLAVEEAKARRRMQEWAVDLAKEDLKVEEARLLVAEARYERSKADIARKAKTRGAAELKLKDFDKQVDDLQRNVKDRQADAEKRRKDSEKDRRQWQALSRKLSELTGGAQGSAWVQ